MSAVEDLRKVLQDFLAPELRAVNARFEAIDRRFDAIETRLKAMQEVVDARFAEVLARLDTLRLFSELDKRVERLETREPRA
ncbi:MAG TPA: hypothetical protein VKV05_03420 [Terriglobales bacterium]|nr:hypothetical protein [Terriglobales bacterium]